jgi:hypothetical protein
VLSIIHLHCKIYVDAVQQGWNAVAWSDGGIDGLACPTKRVKLKFLDRFYYQVRTYTSSVAQWDGVASVGTTWALDCYSGWISPIHDPDYNMGWMAGSTHSC